MSLQGMIKLKCAATNSSEVKRATRLTWGSQETRKHRKQEFLSINLRWWGSQWVRSRSRWASEPPESHSSPLLSLHKRSVVTPWLGGKLLPLLHQESVCTTCWSGSTAVSPEGFRSATSSRFRGNQRSYLWSPTSQEVPDGARSETALDF